MEIEIVDTNIEKLEGYIAFYGANNYVSVTLTLSDLLVLNEKIKELYDMLLKEWKEKYAKEC
jgi:hypothetical protein